MKERQRLIWKENVICPGFIEQSSASGIYSGDAG